jgi:hypothetical protein
MQPDQKQPEIDSGTWWLMGLVAIFFDTTGAGANLIFPVVGQILNDLVADGAFWLWFKMMGMKYSKVTVWSSFAAKFIPILDLFPEYSLMVLLLYVQSKAKAQLKK